MRRRISQVLSRETNFELKSDPLSSRRCEKAYDGDFILREFWARLLHDSKSKKEKHQKEQGSAHTLYGLVNLMDTPQHYL